MPVRQTQNRALQNLCALWHEPLVLATYSGSDIILKLALGMVCGNGFKLIALLQRM